NSVVIWPTRMGWRPTSEVLLYSSKQAAIEVATTGHTDVAPVGRAYPDLNGEFQPWPVVQHETVVAQDRRVVEVAKLAILAAIGSDEAPAGLTHAEAQEVVNRLQDLNVAYCVDNTLSTGPFFRGIISFLMMSSDIAATSGLRFSLTLYRDDVDGLRFDDGVAKTYWNGQLQDRATFLQQLQLLELPKTDSQDSPECGYQGLLQTLEQTRWDELAQRTIIWIGDNSAHPYGSAKNNSADVSAIVKLAKDLGVTVHAVVIKGSGDVAEQELHRRQCEEITAATGGQIFDLNAPQAMAETIAASIGKAIDQEQSDQDVNRTELNRIIAGEQSVAEYLTSPDDQISSRRYRLVTILNAAGIQLSDLQPGVPVATEAWAPYQDGQGKSLHERMVYVSRTELTVLITELQFLLEYIGQDATRGVQAAYQVALESRIGNSVFSRNSFFSNKRDADVPLDVYFIARGLPLRTGISMKTLDELRAMTDDDKAVLRERLKTRIIPKLEEARNSADFTLVGGFEFAWIPESLLP
ncbi:MAG: hypothetical protein KDB23_12865, partial [Planctomycetales bacterium]|nr:hypothetical protein [Planctomycetales bacterium]